MIGLTKIDSMTKVRKFMLKKYPPNDYMDCPVPKHYWEVIEEYATQQTEEVLQLLKDARDMLVLATLLDKSGQCTEMVNKIDKKFTQFNK